MCFKNLIMYSILFFSIIVISSCVLECDEDVVFHGVVSHTYSEYAMNEYTPTNETWMKISIYKIMANVADGPSVIVFEKEFTSDINLPYSYEIEDVNSDMFDFSEYQYFLQCKVYRGLEEGLFVGDLSSEITTEIVDINISNNIELFGIEDCGSENSGGFCSTQFRE